jgi:hypothetical protein
VNGNIVFNWKKDQSVAAKQVTDIIHKMEEQNEKFFHRFYRCKYINVKIQEITWSK